jgi:hypothetical protein
LNSRILEFLNSVRLPAEVAQGDAMAQEQAAQLAWGELADALQLPPLSQHSGQELQRLPIAPDESHYDR